MDGKDAHIALVATTDYDWRVQCELALLQQGYAVHVASEGFQVLKMVGRHVYDFIVLDDSLSDVGPVELSLNVRDVAPNRPGMFVAGNNLDKFCRVWRLCNVFFVGPRERVLKHISAIEKK